MMRVGIAVSGASEWEIGPFGTYKHPKKAAIQSQPSSGRLLGRIPRAKESLFLENESVFCMEREKTACKKLSLRPRYSHCALIYVPLI